MKFRFKAVVPRLEYETVYKEIDASDLAEARFEMMKWVEKDYENAEGYLGILSMEKLKRIVYAPKTTTTTT